MTPVYLRLVPSVALTLAGLALPIAAVLPARAQAQEPTPLPRFEVASVKPSPSDRTRFSIQPGGHVVVIESLKMLIADGFFGAQPLGISRVLGGPEWIESARYEVNAKASTEFRRSPPLEGPPRELLLMLRSLLQERFKLKAHIETRELPVYELG